MIDCSLKPGTQIYTEVTAYGVAKFPGNLIKVYLTHKAKEIFIRNI